MNYLQRSPRARCSKFDTWRWAGVSPGAGSCAPGSPERSTGARRDHTVCGSVANVMRVARDLILVICAVISTACLVLLVYLALNLDISVVDSLGGR
jgi:hypothetical protein